MTDTIETLQSALDDLTRRVAAFEKAQATKLYGSVAQEPPMLTEYEFDMFRISEIHFCRETHKAVRRLRYVEAELSRLKDTTTVHGVPFAKAIEAINGYDDAQAELARLREGLRVQEEDYPDKVIREYCELGNLFAIEIQRHRALVTK